MERGNSSNNRHTCEQFSLSHWNSSVSPRSKMGTPLPFAQKACTLRAAPISRVAAQFTFDDRRGFDFSHVCAVFFLPPSSSSRLRRRETEYFKGNYSNFPHFELSTRMTALKKSLTILSLSRKKVKKGILEFGFLPFFWGGPFGGD